MCGIFGFSLKKGKKANLKKVNTLGIFNIQRGEDSCGYYYSGHIGKGSGVHSNYGEYLMNNPITRGEYEAEVFIGHTRKKSVGVATLENAHPHKVNNYVQVHNGTLYNHWELCRNRGISTTSIHVDSLALAFCIEQDGFGVLEEYDGAAAIAATNMDEPERLFLYHGAQRSTAKGELWEERPLFILEQSEGIYFSSMEESLDFINENKNRYTVEQLDCNVVVSVINGKIVEKDSIYINRADNKVKKTLLEEEERKKAREKLMLKSANAGYTETTSRMSTALAAYHKRKTGNDADDSPSNMALYEWLHTDAPKGKVTYAKGRHWLDGKLCEGEMKIDRDCYLLTNNKESSRVSETYHFFRGVMFKDIKNRDDFWKDVKQLGGIEKMSNFALYISKYTKYPVSHLESECTTLDLKFRLAWYEDRKRVKNIVFTPKFSTSTYSIKHGYLKYIEVIKKQQLLGGEQTTEAALLELDYEEQAKILVHDSAKRIWTKQQIPLLPEVFLCFVDMYAAYFIKAAYGGPATEQEVSAYTNLILKEMIVEKMSLKDMMDLYGHENMVTDENIVISLWNKDLEEIIIEPNRYHYKENQINFDNDISMSDDFSIEKFNQKKTGDQDYSLTDNSLPFDENDKFEENYFTTQQHELDMEIQEKNELKEAALIFDKIKGLHMTMRCYADQLQKLDTCDFAQEAAKVLYVQADEQQKLIENSIKEIAIV